MESRMLSPSIDVGDKTIGEAGMKKFGAVLSVFLALGIVKTASATEIVVMRGNSAQTVTANLAGLTVLRGGGTMQAMQVSQSETLGLRHVTAGETLWILGEDGQPRAACFLLRTEYVGRRKIRCTDQFHK
jgi:hypothetical protein